MELLGGKPKIVIEQTASGLAFNVTGQWQPVQLFAAAGTINRLANSIMDQQEMEQALALETLSATPRDLKRNDQ